MRREIEAALDSKRNIVPVMLDDFDFDTPAIAGQLVGRLAALKHYNGLPVPKGYFPAAMERLRDRFLNVPVDAVLHPASLSAQQAATEQKDKATQQVAKEQKDKAPRALADNSEDEEAEDSRVSQFFVLNKTIYAESLSVKRANGITTDFYKNTFYLCIGNGLETGKVLKRVQARIFFMGEPTVARVKETGEGEIDIRHGEWAFFEIGHLVSTEKIGLKELADHETRSLAPKLF